MTAEAGHSSSRAYFDQDGNLHLNGASVFNAAESDITSTLNLSGDVTATPTELNTLAGVTGGTASASKAVVLDANKQISGMKRHVTTKSSDGAITVTDSIIKITKAGVCALTLADPASGDDGTVITIVSTTANAHTVSNAAGSGFNAGGSSSDVGTFSGAIGDNLVVMALGSKWHVLSSVGVTLG